jgi:hypothetical protein
MTRLVFHSKPEEVPPTWPEGDIHVLLYGSGPPFPGTGNIGGPVFDATSRLGLRPRYEAFDLLTIAMSVTAADGFVPRDEAADRWSRSLEMVVPLARPAVWEPFRDHLQKTLRFLSGDEWRFTFLDGGPPPPSRGVIASRRRVVDLSRADCACLFSGGMDSALGAWKLIGDGARPLLVSHAYSQDQTYQEAARGHLPCDCERFSANAYPTREGQDDDSMRTRSFNFLAYGAIAACAISDFHGRKSTTLFVPENGTIAINAPLTPRRLGSHSTRTTHPFYLRSMQDLFDGLTLPVVIENQFRHWTKGEMLATYSHDATVCQMVVETVSCGKWKREHEQCGRCLPCLIRRAAFFKANVNDTTAYQFPLLTAVLNDEDGRDDLVSMVAAIKRPKKRIASWVAKSGPLPSGERDAYVDVFQRGIQEVEQLLAHHGII